MNPPVPGSLNDRSECSSDVHVQGLAVVIAGASSAGFPPEQLVDAAALALGRPTRATFADGHRDDRLAWRRRRAVVDVALGGHGGADPFADDLRGDHDAFASVLAEPDLVTGPDQVRGFDPCPVDPHVPGPAGTGGG